MSESEIPQWLEDVIARYKAKPSPTEIREAILRATVELDVTQTQLAAMFGTHQQAISRWLNHPETDQRSLVLYGSEDGRP